MSKLAHFWSQYEKPYLLMSVIAQLKLMSNMATLRSSEITQRDFL